MSKKKICVQLTEPQLRAILHALLPYKKEYWYPTEQWYAKGQAAKRAAQVVQDALEQRDK